MVRNESNPIMIIVSGFLANCSAAGALAQHFGRIVVDRNSCLGVQPQQEIKKPRSEYRNRGSGRGQSLLIR